MAQLRGRPGNAFPARPVNFPRLTHAARTIKVIDIFIAEQKSLNRDDFQLTAFSLGVQLAVTSLVTYL